MLRLLFGMLTERPRACAAPVLFRAGLHVLAASCHVEWWTSCLGSSSDMFSDGLRCVMVFMLVQFFGMEGDRLHARAAPRHVQLWTSCLCSSLVYTVVYLRPRHLFSLFGDGFQRVHIFALHVESWTSCLCSSLACAVPNLMLAQPVGM